MIKKSPVVSIVGRRNVGKSTLFNALIKEKKAIVDDHPGLTRDVISYRVNHKKCPFILSDTPGLDLPSEDELSKPILDNAYLHLENSSVIILLFENPNAENFDTHLLSLVRKLNKPTIIAVNKMDKSSDLENMSNFYEIGATDILPISSKMRVNLDLLIEKIEQFLPESNPEHDIADIKISFVGRPNAGKSTLLNSVLGYERSIVSDIPGTTRDTVNEIFTFKGKKIEVIDTAGLKRKSKIKKGVEFFSLKRSVTAINQSDVVIHLIDATVGLTETDKKIADEIMKAHKPLIIAINKWDAIDKDHKTFEEYKNKLTFKFYRAADFPIISISAINRQRTFKLLETTFELFDKARERINTSALNKAIETILKSRRLPGMGLDFKVYYATQVDSVPPSFILFVNKAEEFRKDVVRFFEKEIQKLMNLKGIPILIKVKGKEREKKTKKK